MENEKNEIKPVKILVCSGIKGHIISFVNYLEALYVKKGLFDYVFCIGDFFGDSSNCEVEWNQFKKSGKITSVPIYTLGPNKIDHEKYFKNLQDQELAPNIYYLGKDGIFNTSDGLKIGYISGLQSNTCKENEIHTFNYDSLAKFKDSCIRAGTTSLDILLSSPWPLDIRNKERTAENQNIEELPDKNIESQLLSWIAINLAPRYYFASLQGVFYERSPYKNINSNTITRFIGLGDYHNKSKINKWIYGFNLLPAELTTNKINYTVTESPFSANPSQYTANLLPVSKQYFYNTVTNSNYNHGEPSKKKRFNGQSTKQSIDINSDSCWFCLSSKNVAKHMIISIGDRIYLAGTKGPLIRDHILIASIDHFKSFVELSIESENEINLMKSSLNQYFESTGRVAVYFERNISSAHFQLQVVPVAMEMSDQLEYTFKSKFKELNLNLVDIPPAASLRQVAENSEGNYFYVELPNGKRLFHSAVKKSGHQNFPINLARVVLASPNLLNVQRVDWRQCLETVHEEEMYAKSFRDHFARFNPIKD